MFAQTELFWINTSVGIQRADLQGQNQALIVEGEDAQSQGLTIDFVHQKIYWTNWEKDIIQRADFDGSNVETIEVAGMVLPEGVALDLIHGKMYWVDSGADQISRANLDGSELEVILQLEPCNLDELTLDLDNNHLYWAEYGQTGGMGPSTGKIKRADLDGSNPVILVEITHATIKGIALDPDAGMVYWTDCNFNKIQRANLDGSNVEDLITSGLSSPNSLDLDLNDQQMYWSDGGTKSIYRANFDGSGITLLVGGIDNPQSLAVVNCPERTVDCQGLNRVSAESIFPGNLFPNPFQNQLNLDQLPLGSELRVYTTTGQLIWESTVHTPQLQIHTHSWPFGMLLLELAQDGGRSVQKVIHLE